jgi:hypothetical protein
LFITLLLSLLKDKINSCIDRFQNHPRRLGMILHFWQAIKIKFVCQQKNMEAIKAIAKRTKSGKYKIELPGISNKEEVAVMVIVEENKKNKGTDLAKFAGKLEWKGDPLEYQKKIRDEWD